MDRSSSSAPAAASTSLPVELASVPSLSSAKDLDSKPEVSEEVLEVDLVAYPWHRDPSIAPLLWHDHLLSRFPAPSGFVRVKVEEGSFGAWLRTLPLAAPDTPVVSFRGGLILPAGHVNLAAVSTLDVGKADLQQCADAIMRLHGEWQWSRGLRDMNYRSASGLDLPFSRWERGERIVIRGKGIEWVPQARVSKEEHASFRAYMDTVFAWANTVSLSKQAVSVDIEEIRPGDFFILPGNPGHTVLVLDLAVDEQKKKAVLLGQSYMPAQSFHVFRRQKGEDWHLLDMDKGQIETPTWPKPFPWSSLRRLD